ncbi:MAG: transcriptional regulator [Gammaproteobacteria bacterium]|jgi:hypothetical protein|nr:transcriptional regulator [Gammaproteobacteria bacterium]
MNVLRLALHPEGLAPRVENFGEWRAHLLSRLRHQIDATADPVLVELLAELAIESMFPADPQTAELLAGAARGKTAK